MLLLLLSRPALAELTPAIERIGQPDTGLPDGEVMTIALAVLTVVIKLGATWFARRDAPYTAPRGSALDDPDTRGLLRAWSLIGLAPGAAAAMGPARSRTASQVFGTATPVVRSREPEELPDAAELVERWRPDFSEPRFLDLAEALYRRLLPRRLDQDLGPYEALVRPGAREALLRRPAAEQVTAITAVHTGPARLVRTSADEAWITADVELASVVEEQTPAGPRARLRLEVLRFQTRTESPAAAPDAWRAALEAADDDLLLPQQLGGWVVASLISDRVGPVGLSMLRDVDGPDCSPAGRPGRAPAVDLAADLRAFTGRNPDQGVDQLRDRVRDLAARSLQARLPDAPPPAPEDDLAAWTSPRVQHLHGFWRAVARTWQAPSFDLSPRDRFDPATARITDVHPLRVTLDGRLERLDLAVTVLRPPRAGEPDADETHHVEVWRLGRPVGTDEGWRVVDLRWAPAPIG